MAVSSVRRARATRPRRTAPRSLLATHAVARLLAAVCRPRGRDDWPGGPLVLVTPDGTPASACVTGARAQSSDDAGCGCWDGPALGRALAAAAAGERLDRLARLVAASRLVVVDAVDKLGSPARQRAFAHLVDVAAAAGTAVCVSLERHPAVAALDPRLASRLSAGLVVWLPGAAAAPSRGAAPTIGRVIRGTARHWDLTAADLVGPSRRRAVATARAAAMFLARQLTGSSLGRIGTALGGRDHTTVLHGVRVIAARRDADPAFARELDRLAEAVAGGHPPSPR